MNRVQDKERVLASCTGKQPLSFDTAKKLSKRFKGGMAYKCKFCRAWHVGHSTNRFGL